MKNHRATIAASLFPFLFILLCAAQTPFRGLKPGQHTRTDVERVLGQPVSQPSQTLIEYAANGGLKKIYVQYRPDSAVLEKVEVLIAQPMARDALMQQLNVKVEPVSTHVDSSGRLMEYFGPKECLVFSYETAENAGGVSRVGFYSQELFSAAIAVPNAETVQSSQPPTAVTNSATAPPTLGPGAPPPPPAQLGRTGQTTIDLTRDQDFRVRLLTPLSTKTSNKGDKITAQVLQPAALSGDIMEGSVRSSKSGAKLKGKSVLNFTFDTLHHQGKAIRVQSNVKTFVNSKGQENIDEEGQVVRKKNNLGKVAAATAIGALIGGLAAGGKGAGIGAGVGAIASLVLVEVAVDGANVSLAPGSEFLLSVRAIR